jgi:hypothetical protein
MIAAMSVLIAKFQNTPDMSVVMQTLATVQGDLKTTAETVTYLPKSLREKRDLKKDYLRYT